MRDTDVFVVIIGCAMLGVVFALIEYFMYVDNIILNLFIISSEMLFALMTFTMIGFILLGVLIVANC